MGDGKRSIPELSVDTRLLHQALQNLKPDELITYSALSEIIGRDVTGPARSNLNYARKMARRDDGIVTDAVTKIGIKRLTDQEIVSSVGGFARRHIRRTAQLAAEKLSKVEFALLSNTDKVRQNAELSQLGALRAFAGDKVTVRIESKVSHEQAQLAISKTLEAFNK